MVAALALPLIDRLGATWALVGATALTLLMIFLGIRMQKHSAEEPAAS